MRTTATLSLLLCAVIVALAAAQCGAQFAEDASNTAPASPAIVAMSVTNVNLEFKQTPLADALDTLLKGTGVSYTIDPSVNDLRVSAVLKDVSADKALQEITKAAGAVYRVSNGVITISRPAQPRATPNPPLAGWAGNDVLVIEVRNLNAGDIARVLPNFGASVMVVSGNKLVLSGSQEAIDKTSKVIRALDVPPPAVRPVRVKVTMTLNVTGAKPPRIELSTESIGAEGRLMPLNISSRRNVSDAMSTQYASKPTDLNLVLTPTVCADGSIALTGDGYIEATLPTAEDLSQQITSRDQQTVNKGFQVVVSAKPGEWVTIASGSVDVVLGKASFTVTAVATIEKGTVRSLPPVPEGGPSASPGLPGTPAGRNSYGGGSVGGSL